jgi:hypothetical protein
MDPGLGSAMKKGAPNQGSSRNPDQGAQKNSTWPTLPFGSAVKALLLLHEPRLKLVDFLEAET